MKVKRSAITYTAYDYQTLQGVKLLAEWLDSPTKYTGMAFEADRDVHDTPVGISDIVGERPDGIKDFWQVKFTPSPNKDENRLSWDWLLKISGKTKRSRSILKKFYDAIISVPPENLGDVVLLTNKLPDRGMESCLVGSKIQFDNIDQRTKTLIVKQLGSDEAAEYLFSRLTIEHSDGDYHIIERQVRASLSRISDDAGVDRLISIAREWAMFKDNPPPNGWIKLHHVRERLSPRRPEPIPEIFYVPDNYCLPDSDFHNKILEDIAVSSGEVITLTGKPGGGKSTYLSFLCQELEESKIPFVRHHYFLALSDSTIDRLSPGIVAESLLHQISNTHKEAQADTSRPENLCEALKTCASYYKIKGKPFVVVIDGLDHVWRDNAKDKKPLDEIFKQILPATDNLVVLIGTQDVDDALLPNILLTYSPKQKWRCLPEMSGNVIYEFLKLHVKSGRLFINCQESYHNEDLKNSSNALLQLTNGYPLHVIYSTEYLSNKGLPLSQWQIERLPPCTDGDITKYYNELWCSLNYRQKDVLHLSCGFKFIWPRQAIGKVVSDEHGKAPSVDAVAHLLSESSCGVRPFHESLIVFVTNHVEHQERIKALLSDVCSWLKLDAPEHLKDQWLWSCQALDGKTTELRQGITRDWVLDKLAAGIPVNACIRLLSEAETYAFNDREYAEAYRHRELKTKLINGPELQIGDPSTLKILSLVGADSPALSEILSRENEYSFFELSIIAVVKWLRGEAETAERLSRKAIHRYRSETKLLASQHSQEEESETTVLIYASTLTDSLDYNTIFDEDNFSNWPDSYISSFRTACIVKKDLCLLMRAWRCLPIDSHHTRDIELDAIRLSILEEADIGCWPEYKRFSSQELGKFADVYSRGEFSNIDTEIFGADARATYKIETHQKFRFLMLARAIYKLKTSQNYHSWFFSSLQLRITAEGDFSWALVRAESERIDVSEHYNLLNKIADSVGLEIRAGNKLTFDLMCSLFPQGQVLNGEQWEKRRADISLKREWIVIAADCHLITTKSKISSNELKSVLNSNVFRSDWLRLWYKELNLELLTKDAAKLLINYEIMRQEREIEETTDEKADAFLELTKTAFKHDIHGCFKQCLRKTWDFVLGYMSHEDMTIFNVLDAIKYLAKFDTSTALQILERISPIVFNILKFTDGDETWHSQHSISALLADINPQTAASIYDQALSNGEWYYADKTIQQLIEECDLSEPIIKHLFLTGMPSSCYNFLNKQFETKKDGAAEIVSNIKNLLGINILNIPNKKSTKVDEFEEKITLDPADYPPDSFEKLSEDLKGTVNSRKFWKHWYMYWLEQDKEAELVQQLMPHAPTFIHYDGKENLLDLLFQSQKKMAGKTKAFELLTLAHNTMNGWSDWYESDEDSIKRLGIVSEQYPAKIDEFIKLTTVQSNTWKGKLIIPSYKLVFLLSRVGRIDEAIRFTLVMVERLEESVRNLKFTKPSWDWRSNDSIDDTLSKLLISRLKCPVPSIKLWVTEQLALLLNNEHPKIEILLKQDLANRKQESECVEKLCVFYIAQSKGYKCPQDLGNYIKARSTLSDLILSKLIQSPDEFGEYAYRGMPKTYAEDLSVYDLPIEPAYIGLKPQKPTWLPEWDKDSNVDGDSIAKFVKVTLANFKLKDDSRSLLAYSLPIKIDEHTWIDLSVVKASVVDDLGKDLQLEEPQGCTAISNLLDPEITYEFSNNDEIHGGVMATTLSPFNRYGHWHADMEARGLYVPKSNINGKKIVGRTADGVFCYYTDKSKLGFSTFWFADWQPKHPKGIRSLCGSSTEIYNDKLREWYSEKESFSNYIYVCKAKILSSEDSYKDFNEQELNFIIT